MALDYGLQLVAPFSPTILKATMPPAMVDILNGHADEILSSQEKAQARDWSRHLAGVVRHEINVTDVIKGSPATENFIFDIARLYAYRCENALLHFTDYSSTDRLRDTKLRIDIKEGWINNMVAGDYNPVHFHQGCHFSSVGFLALPPQYEAEFSDGKSQQSTAGCLQFIYSRSAVGLKNLFTIKPAVGDFYLWPSWMLHCVYPFKSSGTRRSVAINIALR